jgi:hypothetical protein
LDDGVTEPWVEDFCWFPLEFPFTTTWTFG